MSLKDEQEAIDLPTQRSLVDNEIMLWRNTRYQLQLRHRVQKAIGGTAEQLKPIEEELVKCEAAIDELGKILGELDGKGVNE